MENWPLFEERYAAEVQSVTPAYVDGVLMIAILLLLIGATLWAVSRSSKAIHSIGFKITHRIASSLITIVLAGLLYGLILAGNSEASSFWSISIEGMLYTLGFFLFTTLLYTWIWYTFGLGVDRRQWLDRYFQLWGLLGFSLYIPLTITLYGLGSEMLLFITVVSLYIIFKALLFIMSLQTFRHLLKYPLHIILYLCTCEMLPLLFVYNGVMS